jgi:hypothetical protein
MPRFVFYSKKRLPITKKRFFIIKTENAQHWTGLLRGAQNSLSDESGLENEGEIDRNNN